MLKATSEIKRHFLHKIGKPKKGFYFSFLFPSLKYQIMSHVMLLKESIDGYVKNM